jgi:hypothetical protein
MRFRIAVRQVFLIVGVLCVAALSVYAGYRLSPLIDQLLPVEEVTLASSGAQVEMAQAVFDALTTMYSSYDSHEFAACLQGYYDVPGDRLVINDMRSTKILNSSANRVQHQVCTAKGDIGSIHNHPSGFCKLSDQDLYAWGHSEEAYMSVICGTTPSRVAVYGVHDFDRKLPLKVV